MQDLTVRSARGKQLGNAEIHARVDTSRRELEQILRMNAAWRRGLWHEGNNRDACPGHTITEQCHHILANSERKAALEGTINRNYDFRVSVMCVELVRVGAGGFEGGMQDARGT